MIRNMLLFYVEVIKQFEILLNFLFFFYYNLNMVWKLIHPKGIEIVTYPFFSLFFLWL